MVIAKKWIPALIVGLCLIAACSKGKRVEEKPAVPALKHDSDALTKAQTDLLEMYEEMVALIPADGGALDCDALAAQFMAIAERDTPKIQSWSQRMGPLNAEERAEEEARFAKTTGGRMERMQAAIRKSIESCSKNQKFMSVFAHLSSMSPPMRPN